MNVPAGLKIRAADATKPEDLSACLIGHDAVISASRFVTSNVDSLIVAVKKAGVRRLLVVGGAGSLQVAPGKALMDMDNFPDASKAKPTPDAHFLKRLKDERYLDWTFHRLLISRPVSARAAFGWAAMNC